MRMTIRYTCIPFLLMVLLFLSGCNVPAPLENIILSVKKLVTRSDSKVVISPLPINDADPATAAMRANAELVAEMIKITFNQKEIQNQSLFQSLASSVIQGASLEGTYRGLVMSSQYRVLESKAPAASPNMIKFFANEMAELQEGMKNPTQFNADTAKRFPEIEYPDGADEVPSEYRYGEVTSTPKPNKNENIQKMMENFIGATPFTLKRVISEEVLKKMDELKDSPGDVAQWYAAFVVRMVETSTDFGLKQRNSNDFDFHFRFAKTTPIDRLKWEALNRYHRVLNRTE